MALEVMISLLSRHTNGHESRTVETRLRNRWNTREEPALPDDTPEHMQRKNNEYHTMGVSTSQDIPTSSLTASSPRKPSAPPPNKTNDIEDVIASLQNRGHRGVSELERLASVKDHYYICLMCLDATAGQIV